jgi:hypothetical protein
LQTLQIELAELAFLFWFSENTQLCRTMQAEAFLYPGEPAWGPQRPAKMITKFQFN